MGIKKKFLPVITFARVDIKRLFRDKVAIFFVFAFPLLFLIVFGGIFGRESEVSFNVAVLNQSETEFSNDFKKRLIDNGEVLEVNEEITSLEQAKESMNRGELDAAVVLPPEFGQVSEDGYPQGQAKVLYSQSNEQAGLTLSSILEAIFQDINSELVPTEAPFTVQPESTATEGLSSFDYIFSGLLGFTLLSLGIFGPTNVFPRLKQRGILRRYHTTPLRVWQYFTGNVISNMAVGLLAVGLMFATGVFIFNFTMRGDYFNFAVIVLIGTVLMYGIGLALGGWAKNENQAAPLANLITFPMMFLSGVFFPRFLMPEWLQDITYYIPLTPIIDSLRLVSTEGKVLADLGSELAIMGGWIVIIYFIAFKFFRWE